MKTLSFTASSCKPPIFKNSKNQIPFESQTEISILISEMKSLAILEP